MNRLQDELRRLYLVGSPSLPGRVDAVQGTSAPAASPPLIDAAGNTRALVLQLARPASWSEVSALWRSVQVDLDLPAPAIAITGIDALQLWFSLREPVPISRATTFLRTLCRVHLPDVKPDRLAVFPDANPSGAGGHAHLPPMQVRAECWSAFIAPDLAPLFDGEPWLDHPPGTDAQADLLSRIESASADAFERACARLEDGEQAQRAVAQAKAPAQAEGGEARAQQAPSSQQDAEQFLIGVMNDRTVDMHLRIEAAKALLPHTTRRA
jgi:hypothetical protein